MCFIILCITANIHKKHHASLTRAKGNRNIIDFILKCPPEPTNTSANWTFLYVYV